MIRKLAIFCCISASLATRLPPKESKLETLDHEFEYFSPPHYSFEYSVHDGKTGDVKKQHETRKGENVEGYYMLHEADGSTREVHYTADENHGFKAVVTNSKGEGISRADFTRRRDVSSSHQSFQKY